MEYIVYFNIDGICYRLPTNPEEIQTDMGTEYEEYKILNTGNIVVPTTEKLKTIKFTCELPSYQYGYVENRNEFYPAKFYLDLFQRCISEKKVIRVVIYNPFNMISELVILEGFNFKEKAGEEGDYSVDFNLKRYVPYGIKSDGQIKTITKGARESRNNGKSGRTHILQKNETLWGITKKYLGDGSRYKELLEYNPHLGENPLLIKEGAKIRIP